MSRMAAPVGDVTTPMQRGSTGSGFLRASSNKPSSCKFFLQLLEGELQRAEADRLDVGDVNLIFAARFVDAERAAHRDVQSVLGAELQAAHLIAKADAANLRARVLQREIKMPGLRRVVVRDFAFDPHVAECAFEQIARCAR